MEKNSSNQAYAFIDLSVSRDTIADLVAQKLGGVECKVCDIHEGCKEIARDYPMLAPDGLLELAEDLAIKHTIIARSDKLKSPEVASRLRKVVDCMLGDFPDQGSVSSVFYMNENDIVVARGNCC